MKEVTMRVAKLAKLTTPTDLGEKARQAISVVLNQCAADAFALYVKTKNYHWHVSGSHYRDYHLLFDEQATQILAMIDVLAERVRKIGGTTLRSIEHIAHLQKIHDDNDVFVAPKEMVARLLHDNKECLVRMRKAHKICDDHNDVASASILEVFIDEMERRIWFLFETYQVD